jgi:hypothetical protein
MAEILDISFADLEKATTAHLKILSRMIRLELQRRAGSGK